MFEAKALVGKKAGEIIYAKDSSLTHELCKLWKIYCPECKQFLYFSKSKNPDKRRSYFGHYDYEDKRCPERSFAVNQGNQSKSLAESHEQDLETAEFFIEQVFYGIDREYFQNLNQRENEEENQKITDAVNWFKSSLLHDCKNWIRYYCQTTGFLDWNNSEKDVSYLMDWLHVLARRDDILKSLTYYFILNRIEKQIDATSTQAKFGIVEAIKSEQEIIWLVALEEILERLANVATGDLPRGRLDALQVNEFIDLKIPANEKKTPFKDRIKGTLAKDQMSILVRENESRGFNEFIFFSRKNPNCFCYRREYDSLESIHPGFLRDDALLLYIDKDGDLAVKGFLDRRLARSVIKDISKVLFNGSYSMLVFLKAGCISQDIAEKVAQLALRFEFGDLSPPEAFEKFRLLSGIKT
jgi:hypothetical protein